MDPLKPPGFGGSGWPALDELFGFRSNGIVTYRDEFVYATTQPAIAERIQHWLQLPLEQAKKQFGDSALKKTGPAMMVPFGAAAIEHSLTGGLKAAYGGPVAPADVFDAVLTLLSASSYTTRFAFDLEDDFPHVPFSADPESFADAAHWEPASVLWKG